MEDTLMKGGGGEAGKISGERAAGGGEKKRLPCRSFVAKLLYRPVIITRRRGRLWAIPPKTPLRL